MSANIISLIRNIVMLLRNMLSCFIYLTD